jgi:hypothetical protein
VTQPPLPMWRVLFVDWHGVLSNDPYWASILNGTRRKLRTALKERLNEVFDPDCGLSDDWMRGHTTTGALFTRVGRALSRREQHDFLERRIVQDCVEMRLERSLTRFLRAHAREDFRAVLATDNTADFERAFHVARSARRREGSGMTLKDVAPLFDGILCSAQCGLLKHEDPQRFFGPWLDENGLSFSDALLIDDRVDNCAAFVDSGGQAIVWGQTEATRTASLRKLERWGGDPFYRPDTGMCAPPHSPRGAATSAPPPRAVLPYGIGA